MIYHADSMVLSSIREVFHGPCNDVVICRDLNSAANARYTLLAVRDRECAKKMLSVFQNSSRGTPDREPYLKMFTENELLCFLFEYRPERRLELFAPGQLLNPVSREKVCVNLVMECLSSPLPFPLLYLVLTEENVHLQQDNSVYFTDYFDLSQLDEEKNEAACTDRCVEILLDILQSHSRKQLKSYALLRKKADRNAYQMFPELYRDIRLTAIPEQKTPFRQRAKNFWFRNKDRFFRILLFISCVAVVIALLMLLSQLIFGDIPFFRIFQNTFEKIGTENLTLS